MLVAPSAAERIGLRLENQLLQHVSPRFEPQLAIGSSVTAFLQSSGCFLRYLLSVHTNLARPVVEINGILAVPYARQHIECRLTVSMNTNIRSQALTPMRYLCGPGMCLFPPSSGQQI